ncbi:MAG: hypothetical protein JW801_12920 [Bacteroidales bacterium]|nr:hypothetical protein [Bacteroidales bacterium]
MIWSRRKYHVRGIFFILLIIALTPVKSQDIDPLTDNFYHQLYSFRFREAKQTLGQIRETNRDPLIKEMMYISYEWWMLISSGNEIKHARYLLDRIEGDIKKLDQRLKSGNFKQGDLLQMIMLYSYQSRINNHIDNRINGFISFKASEEYFKKLAPCEDLSCDVYNLVAGLYYTLTGYIQKEYPAIFRVSFDAQFANIDLGLSLLAKCQQSVIDQIRTESAYFFMKLYLEVEKNFQQAELYASQLIKKYPDNLIFRLNHLTILDKLGKKDDLLAASEHFMKLTESQAGLTGTQRAYFIRECQALSRNYL